MKLRFFFLILVLLNGCQTVSPIKQQSIINLNNTLRTYQTNYRWGNLAQIIGYAKTPAATKLPDNIGNIRIVKYDVLSSAILTSETTAIQEVQIEYIYIDKQTVRKLIDHQEWEYDTDKSTWYRTNPLPQF